MRNLPFVLVIVGVCYFCCSGQSIAGQKVTVTRVDAQVGDYKNWPVLKRYDVDHLGRIALPLGGIGTGTVSLGGRGDLCDWEIMNRPAKGFIPRRGRLGPFFALYLQTADGQKFARALEGPVELSDYQGADGSAVPNHGLPRFRNCSFAAAYPLGQVILSDPDVPVEVRLKAFNPLVPPDAELSGIPVAILIYVFTNKTDKPLAASICGSMPNFIGTDGAAGSPKANRNELRSSPAKVRAVGDYRADCRRQRRC